MSALILSGHIVDLIIAILAIEVLVLATWRRAGLVTPIIAALPGAFLLLALRAALMDAGWMWIGLWLTASFPAHLADLWRRPAS
jgi:hypothetical protein